MKSKEATAGLSEGQLAEASEEGLGSKGAVVPMMMMMLMIFISTSLYVSGGDRMARRLRCCAKIWKVASVTGICH